MKRAIIDCTCGGKLQFALREDIELTTFVCMECEKVHQLGGPGVVVKDDDALPNLNNGEQDANT